MFWAIKNAKLMDRFTEPIKITIIVDICLSICTMTTVLSWKKYCNQKDGNKQSWYICFMSDKSYPLFLTTVSAQIERHSWLERQGILFGCTMVIFSKKLCKSCSIFGQNLPKMTKVQSQKFLNSNKMPALYLRGYSNQN